ncbi:MAG: DUF937 domain-containing protein [Polaromonas sp.]|uniref:YidB family protein n=1 Tax=Polaromonas sp. TaxID=1869339 RepID=UPI00183D9830|nr:YidB family protein [Polaromonas sp.]MBA3594984.1 DUF937 domain-containing protein [Polaromonas sp.]
MANNLIEQILAGVLSNGMGGRGQPGVHDMSPGGGGGGGGGLGDLLGGGGGGGLGDLLGGILGGGGAPAGANRDRSSSSFGGSGGALIAMLLPLAMQWVQRNGGLGAVLGKFQQKGYSQQAASWVSTGDNESLSQQAVEDVVGLDELSRLSQQLGVPEQQVANGFAQILPEMVNQLTPQGNVSGDADDALRDSMAEVQAMLSRMHAR